MFSFPKHFQPKKKSYIMFAITNWFWNAVFGFLCHRDRHDYEAYLMENDGAWMECNHCKARKKSYAPHVSSRIH